MERVEGVGEFCDPRALAVRHEEHLGAGLTPAPRPMKKEGDSYFGAF